MKLPWYASLPFTRVLSPVHREADSSGAVRSNPEVESFDAGTWAPKEAQGRSTKSGDKGVKPHSFRQVEFRNVAPDFIWDAFASCFPLSCLWAVLFNVIWIGDALHAAVSISMFIGSWLVFGHIRRAKIAENYERM